MAYTAANIRFFYDSLRFLAKSRNFHATSEPENCPLYLTLQYHVRARIRAQYARDRACLTDINRPMMRRGFMPDQPAFLNISTAEIIPIKKFTIKSKWCLHCISFSLKLVPSTGDILMTIFFYNVAANKMNSIHSPV
jgi:hypothetical protein